MRLGSLAYSDNVLLEENRNQSKLANLSTELASGLRINSAADDPSGNAIATRMQTISDGLDQGQRSIQNAKNLLTVAEGAMETITEILQRMRSLIVEANSDINSAQNKASIQAELDQLKLEVNRISENANFNGLKLLDGSLASTQTQAASFIYASNPTVGDSPLPLIDVSSTNIQPNAQQTQFSFSVDSYDASSNLLQVTFTVSSPDASFGPTQVNTLHVTPGTNYFDEFGPGSAPYVVNDQNNVPVFQFNFNTLSQDDVGKEALVVSVPTQQGIDGHALEVNTGTSEGSTISTSIGAMDTQHLAVNDVQVGDLLANQAAETRVDYALDKVTSTRAAVGAQEVSLGEAADNAAIQETQQISSESSIRDLNVGTAVTAFTKQQILVSVGTSVISQMQVSTLALTNILIGALVA